MTSVGPALVADTFVSLAALAGLIVYISTTREYDQSRLHARITFGMSTLAAMLGARVAYWHTGVGVFQSLAISAAALIPLATLLLVEGLLRRHTPRWMKIPIAAGSVALALLAWLPAFRGVSWQVIAIFALQLATFTAAGWMVMRRGRSGLSASETQAVYRLALALPIIFLVLITDSRFVISDLPVRLGGIAILCLCWLGISLNRSNVDHRDIARAAAVQAICTLAAGWAASLIVGLDWQGSVQVAAVVLSAALLSSVYNESYAIANDERRETLMHHLANANTSSLPAFVDGLRKGSLFDGAIMLGADEMDDFDVDVLCRAFASDPVRVSAASGSVHDRETHDQLAWLFDKSQATHALLLSPQPLRLLLINRPQLSGSGAQTELRALQRMAALVAERETLRDTEPE